MADETQIKKFLHDVKHADIIDFVPTEKNRKTRLYIGLTAHDQDDLVRNLKVNEYHSGPSKGKDPSKVGLVWVFLAQVSGGYALYQTKRKNHCRRNYCNQVSKLSY